MKYKDIKENEEVQAWIERKDNIENTVTISLTYMQDFNYVQKSGKSRGCCKGWNTCNDAWQGFPVYGRRISSSGRN